MMSEKNLNLKEIFDLTVEKHKTKRNIQYDKQKHTTKYHIPHKYKYL